MASAPLLRFASPAATSRGFGGDEFAKVAELIAVCLDGLSAHGEEGNKEIEAKVKGEVAELTKRFPIY